MARDAREMPVASIITSYQHLGASTSWFQYYTDDVPGIATTVPPTLRGGFSNSWEGTCTSRQGDPWATTLPVWALVCEQGCTPYMVQVEPRKGTHSAVTRQPLIDKPSSLTYPATGRR
jgi:hypothetical protein